MSPWCIWGWISTSSKRSTISVACDRAGRRAEPDRGTAPLLRAGVRCRRQRDAAGGRRHSSISGRSLAPPDPVPASITSWTRFGPQCRYAEMGRSVGTRLFDRLWLIRPSMADGQGVDAGTPVQARVRATSAIPIGASETSVAIRSIPQRRARHGCRRSVSLQSIVGQTRTTAVKCKIRGTRRAQSAAGPACLRAQRPCDNACNSPPRP